MGDGVVDDFGDLDLSATVVFFGDFTVFARLIGFASLIGLAGLPAAAGLTAGVGLFLLGFLGSFFNVFVFSPEVSFAAEGFAAEGFALFLAFDLSAMVLWAEAAAGFLAGAGFFLEGGTGRLLGVGIWSQGGKIEGVVRTFGSQYALIC